MPHPGPLHGHRPEVDKQDSSGTTQTRAEGGPEGGRGVNTIIANGKVVNSEGEFHADVLVDCGRIVAVGLDLPRDDATVVDASGAYAIPGSIDAHTHFKMRCGGTASCETRPQYLALSVDDFDAPGFEGAKLICSPPLREEANC